MTPAASDATKLELALIGQLDRSPASGYELRKAFTATPLAHFSDSPGAIYPALRRLALRGWIEAVPEEPRSARRRQRFRLSTTGRRAFLEWLALPPARAEVVRDLDGLMLRFAFMSQALPTAAERFLKALRAEVRAYLRELERFLLAAGNELTVSGRLAVEAGTGRYRSLLRWTTRAEREVRGPSLVLTGARRYP